MHIVFISGPHCSGKSSIIRNLTERRAADASGHEIGKEFYYKRRDAGFATQKADSGFEQEVTDAEINRDLAYLGGSGIALVESWHPGNLAYIMKRNPEYIIPAVRRIIDGSPYISNGHVTGIRIEVSAENIYKRTKTFSNDREWAAEFYGEINTLLPEALDMLGLTAKTVTIDGNRPFELVQADVAQAVQSARVTEAGLLQPAGKGTSSIYHFRRIN